jgi:imidazole glycerol-phosphate synthase subunit HisH
MVAIVKYNAGNIQSVLFALERIGVEAVWTDDPEVLQGASHVIFPGVGEASTAMQYLRERELDKVIKGLTQPVLGICLGLQLFCAHSEENDAECLGIFDNQVRLFPAGAQKVPHIGWNGITHLQSPLFRGVEENAWTYFVHSYYAETGEWQCATCDYIVPFAAALHRDNFYAVQFHPEKSSGTGQQILRNFLTI